MNKKNGFTLIEILIALAVFAILATITSSAMYYAFNTRDRITHQAERLVDLQLTITQIERDTEQIANRSIRVNGMQLLPALIGQNDKVELTRGGISNPLSSEKRSSLKRIAYLCKNKKLIRRSWVTIDPIDYNTYKERTLLRDLTQCEFAYVNQTLQVLSEWHGSSGPPNQNNSSLPKAVRLTIGLQNNDNMSFLFIFPEGLYASIK